MGCKSQTLKNKKESQKRFQISQSQLKKSLEVKIVLLGDQKIGKSSIVHRYYKNLFIEKQVAAIGGAYFQQKVQLKTGESILLSIWDTGGKELFGALSLLC